MRGIFFIAMLFCMGASALLGGAIALYENVQFAIYGRPATMELADPSKKVILTTGGPDFHLLDVRYSSPKGQLVVRGKRLGGAMVARLAAGEKVPVIYFENNPQKYLLSRDELPSPWLWLVVGVAAMWTFRYAVVLRRREALERDA
jgi:hypothetical protein